MSQILKEALQNHMTLCWIFTSTHKHHIISIQYPSHKVYMRNVPDCLRILIMSWLFKDSVVITKEIMSWLLNSGLAQFQPFPIKSKKSPKKIKLSLMNFFLKNNKTLMYLSALFIVQNLRKVLRANPELRGCAIFGPKIRHLPWTKIFHKNHWY